VQRYRCSPASDRKEPPLDLTQLEDEMHDRLMRFKKHRASNQARKSRLHGFWKYDRNLFAAV
jgi:hypothetical protein